MISWEDEHLPLDFQEQLWESVVSFERGSAGDKSYFVPIEVLKEDADGVEFPSAGELDDEALTRKLWEMIHAMARRRWYLVRTDHLSDRELYAVLGEDILAAESVSAVPGASLIIDVLGGCSPEDVTTALRYYFNEDDRRVWAKSFPEDEVPEAEDPPYDRDRHLPQAWGPSGWYCGPRSADQRCALLPCGGSHRVTAGRPLGLRRFSSPDGGSK